MEIANSFNLVIMFGSLLISAILHEIMHGMTALWLGDDTAKHMGRLTLNPLAHIDPFMTLLLPLLLSLSGLPPLAAAKPVPFNPNRVKYGEYGAALVGLAGPLTNLALALIVGLWIRFVVGFEEGISLQILYTFMVVNLSLFVFNLIPFPPLDGSRVLYAFAPEPLQNLMRSIEQMGIFAILVFYMVLISVGSSFLIFLIYGLAEIILGINVVS